MKIYEVMKELHENKNKVARHTLKDESGYLELKIFENNYKIALFNKDGGSRMLDYTFKDMIDTEKEWEIVQEPVLFEEVVNSSKECRVEHDILIENEFDFKTFKTFDELMFEISNITNACEMREIIKNGKWYLQE